MCVVVCVVCVCCCVGFVLCVWLCGCVWLCVVVDQLPQQHTCAVVAAKQKARVSHDVFEEGEARMCG